VGEEQSNDGDVPGLNSAHQSVTTMRIGVRTGAKLKKVFDESLNTYIDASCPFGRRKRAEESFGELEVLFRRQGRVSGGNCHEDSF